MTIVLLCIGVILLFYSTTLNAQTPVADFTADVTSGCIPLTVNFNDLSANTPTSWFWEFGNSNTSILQNPSAVYLTPGTYTVTLIAYNSFGNDTMVKFNYITVFESPTADFTSDTTSGCNPLTVQFTDLSNPGSSAITSWFWDFGDGNSDTLSNPIYTYDTQGSYYVSITVTNADGCGNSFSRSNYITINEGPQAGFTKTADTACSIPFTVNFSDISTQGSAAITSWRWYFGDGDSSTTVNPSHTYTSLNTFNVMLIITDAGGCSDTAAQDVSIINFQANFDYTVTCDNKQTFTINFTDLSTPPATGWFWDFGDGDSAVWQNPGHTYPVGSTDTITLIASIDSSCIDTITRIYASPKAKFSPDTSYFCETPFLVTFTNLSTGTAPLFYQWDLGDDTTTNSVNVTHTYSVPNLVYIDTFFVSLVVTNGFGCTDTLNDTIIFHRPQAGFIADPDEGCIPLEVNFTDTSFSDSTIAGWFWDFGDGFFSTDTNPSHTYTDTGHYTVSLIITNILGCKDTVVGFVKAGIKPDFVDFFSPFDTTCGHVTPCFTDLSGFIDTNVKVNNWDWCFSSSLWDTCSYIEVSGIYGAHSDLQNPCHHYNYGRDTLSWDTVRLIAGFNGCNDTAYKSIVFTPLHSDPMFFGPYGFKHAACSTPATFSYFNATSIYDVLNWYNIVNLETGDTVIHSTMDTSFSITFTKAGNYLVRLSVSYTPVGCTDIEPCYMKIDSVQNGFTVSPKNTCLPGNTFAFTDTSVSYFGLIREWFWDFGDGDTLKNDKIEIIVNYQPVSYFLEGNDTVRPIHNHDGYTSGTYNAPVHTYRDTGTYIVTSIITDYVIYDACFVAGIQPDDTLFCYFTTIDTIRVHNIYPDFEADTITGCPGLTVNFSDLSVTTSSIASWEWDFGDFSGVSAAQNPIYTYSNAGSYYVRLIVEDIQGCRDTIKKLSYINITLPTPNFNYTSQGCINGEIIVIDNSTGTGLSWFWDFGDGYTDSIANTSHVYTDSGTYTISLTVTDTNGCDNTFSQVVTVVPFPTAGFDVDTFIAACPPLVVVFTDSSFADIVSWSWDFGDSAVSAIQNPVHTFFISRHF